MIENMGFPSVLAGKPVSLLGVAAGRIGAIKSLESLRGVCSHIGAIVLPRTRLDCRRPNRYSITKAGVWIQPRKR